MSKSSSKSFNPDIPHYTLPLNHFPARVHTNPEELTAAKTNFPNKFAYPDTYRHTSIQTDAYYSLTGASTSLILAEFGAFDPTQKLSHIH